LRTAFPLVSEQRHQHRGAHLVRVAKPPSWAADIARIAAADFLASLVPISAAAKLIAAGLQVSLAGVNTLRIPRREGLANPAVACVIESAPHPIAQYVLA
jgi:hypothetical protein